ncbi:MAG: hypothetical protein A3H98_12305 [Bacteroidetes bacterium RIFCSPLOWO2_02_FULL_36_8]|nr:MAG: hypothetical protein A3H98_12305 [Bacteroidetes bacterium RIFCSPLOWO2_02_FULL_36_8]OFY71077.1 MAG: hypothetical protein A3G23_14800 [Bacteroidetes bacterium RIFCSPLOWO2_12_FULL_37_12]
MYNINKELTTKQLLQIIVSFIGLFSAVIGIYVFFFQDKKVFVEYEILTDTNVLDINANITKLDISYDGTSLKNKNENLRIINLCIRNSGSESILKNYYDNNDPLGLSITNGRIIEQPELINTSNNYLKNNLQIKFDSSGRLTFNDVILDANQYFTIKILVLHPSRINPTLNSFGKIAGQNNIPLISHVKQTKDQISFWLEPFVIISFAQIARDILYSFVIILILIGISIVISKISDYVEKRKRIKIVMNFKNLKTYEYSRMDDAIFSRFKNQDSGLLFFILDLLNNENLLDKEFFRPKYFDKDRKGSYIIDEMINDGYAIKDKEALIINLQMKKSLTQFISYLNEIKNNKNN